MFSDAWDIAIYLKVNISINSVETPTLINTGTEINIISKKKAEELGLPITLGVNINLIPTNKA